MDKTFVLSIILVLFCFGKCLAQNETKLDAIEITTKLLIDLDEKIEKCLESDPIVKPVDKFSQLYIPPNENEIQTVREEKFSEVLRDLAKMETQIQEAIRQAQINRRYQLVVRLRPLLNYVTNIRRNMDLLRNRMVAVTTLSTIAFTVNEVIDQFSDVMTGSFVPGGVVSLGDRVAVSAIKEQQKNQTSVETTEKQNVPKSESNSTLI